MRSALASLIVLFACLIGVSSAAEPVPEEAIEEFKRLQVEFKEIREQYYKLFEAVAKDEQETLYLTKYPSETMVQEFLDLEKGELEARTTSKSRFSINQET